MGDRYTTRLWALGDVERQIRAARRERSQSVCRRMYRRIEDGDHLARECWQELTPNGGRLTRDEMCPDCQRRHDAHRRLATLRRRRAAMLVGIERITRGTLP